MPKVTFYEDRCKGCGLCIEFCPQKILEFHKDKVNEKGFRVAQITDQDKCIGCTFCAIMCPDIAIEIER